MHSLLLTKYLTELKQSTKLGPIMDLACGLGRNGLYLAKQGLPVVFADKNQQALDEIDCTLTGEDYQSNRATTWLIDLETEKKPELSLNYYGAIIVYRYLHRPLFNELKASISSGGLVVYETFTRAQKQFGRPKRDEFLLTSGELEQVFSDWQVLHSFEGTVKNEQGNSQAIAQIVARKP